MVYVTTITITATGEAQRVQTTQKTCAWVTLQADAANSGTVYHGPSSVTTSNGQAIGSGGGGGSPQYPPIGHGSMYDLSRIYVIGTANDIVRIMYGVI